MTTVHQTPQFYLSDQGPPSKISVKSVSDIQRAEGWSGVPSHCYAMMVQLPCGGDAQLGNYFGGGLGGR